MARTSLYERIRRKTTVPATERDVERVLASLKAAQDIWELMGICDVPLAVLPVILEECQREGLLRRQGDRWELTSAGRAFVEERGWTPLPSARCPACLGRGLDLSPLQKLLEKFTKISEDRPPAHAEYDQGYVTPETTIARIALMRLRGDLDGKRVIVLGDDDLVGIAAALSGFPQHITVLEIDQDLVAFIQEIQERFGLPRLDVRAHDLQDPLPHDLLRSYDTFASDPPESLDGFKLFVSRGLSTLRGEGSAGYFGLSRHEASLAKWHQLQAWLLMQGAAITDVIDDFNTYLPWPYWEEMRARHWLQIQRPPTRPWYRSTLYRVELILAKEYPNEPFQGTFEDPELATVGRSPSGTGGDNAAAGTTSHHGRLGVQ